MTQLRYTKDHEWVQGQEDGTVRIGITDYARDALGDLVYLDLPKVGKTITKGGHFAVIESVKAASEIYTPIAGEVADVNTGLADALDQLGQNPDTGWIIALRPESGSDLSQLMDDTAYQSYVKGL
ncbi:MAG: glycine cleavage system protein GcvH [Pseudomonadota bacterium]